ncbi:type I CRISPR-associated protein Cas7 [Clostridium estertheticum]|uniref:type I CRISPR-associated protein Cas7 n=1 Tax=Clostridium estertheticum TaxID=238834 RepID=UPI001C0D57FA|nr:type I CRISPR-associated protein Cas7 [Clostridium estertheticum]MBU3187231.1 type I CRISPR-associated protein Cas7 [Clostridium estertheticum]MCB2358687.1 type I CRISPR-associated protein Cas7 [Clostridium estertheticum]
MENRVYGVIGIKAIMANWNADFSGQPKSISTGEIFGSDKALKYPMKKMWENSGEKVLYIKSLKMEEKKDEIKIKPKSLKERYEEVFQVEDLKKEKDNNKVMKNLFKAIDVKNFGATFAEEGTNISITGAVQIGQGFNKYEDTTVEEQQILSPFRDGTKDDADASTLGTKIVSSEAHYFYPFVINPISYKNHVEMGVTEGYTEDDYKNFKEVALVSATAFNTNAKLGCENEFAIFVETQKDLYLPDLAQYINFTKVNGQDIITLKFEELLNKLSDRIINIEIYYNSYKTRLEGNINKAKCFNIFTREEV